MATVVLVHGIDQQQRGADTLESTWLPALADGVRAAGFAEIADRIWRRRGTPDAIESRMAFYGALFLHPDQMGDDPGEFDPAEAVFAEDLAEEWLIRAASRSSRTADQGIAARELAYLRQEIGEEEMGAGELVRRAIRSAARLSWFAPYGMGFAERFVKRSLAQVTHYFTDASIRRAARQIVSDLIGADTKIIVGHSLGSVIAYEVVRQLEQPLPLLLTLGSPLGLETIIYQKLEPQPPGFPATVRRWVNVADRDDYIAAEPDLTAMFSGGIPHGAIFEGGYTVKNGAKPHEATFYLTKSEVGLPIAQTLTD